MRLIKNLLVAAWLCAQAYAAHAAIDAALLKPLAGDDPDARIEAIGKIAALANEDALKVLNALKNDTLYANPSGEIFIVENDQAYNPETGKTGAVPQGIDGITANNRLRGAVDDALAGLKLISPDRAERLAAATELQKSANAAQAPLINKALEKETDPEIKPLLQLAAATANLESTDPAVRKAAIKALAGSSNANLKPVLQKLLEKKSDGTYVEPDEGIRAEAESTLSALNGRLARTEFVGNLFYGISLGSVLLLAALGLAITFGLMGIINMAHGGAN